MSFQPHPALIAAPRFSLGAVVSFCLIAGIFLALAGVAVIGFDLVGW